MRQPKILMFGWEFPPHNSGGLGVACLGLTKAMVREGAEIIFVLPSFVDVSTDYMKVVLAKDRIASKVHFRKFPSLLYPYITEDAYAQFHEFVNSQAYGNNLQEEVLRYASYAKSIAQGESFDVIHAHDWLTYLAGIEAKRATDKPLIVHVHSTEYDRTGGTGFNQFVYDIERFGMEKADKIIAISRYTKNIIIEHYGIDSSKIVIVHNGIEGSEGHAEVSSESTLRKLKDAGNSIVLFIGRLTIQKGPDYFLAMAKKVLEYMPETIFVIAGSGDMERRLMMQAAQLGISRNVFFLGFLRGSKKEEVYHMADLFIMPSVSEPFGLTALESMVRGTPIIVSKQSGVSEIIEHALKVDFWDTEEMADKTIAVLQHKSLKEQLSHAGKKEASGHDWVKAAKKSLALFRELAHL